MPEYTAVIVPVSGHYNLCIYKSGGYSTLPGTTIIRCYSRVNISVYKLSRYIDWKIGSVSAAKNAAEGYYVGIQRPIEWIRSIIETEFDYHLGNREVCCPENAGNLAAYIASAGAGYGL